jgi:hypothetical protein
LSEPNFTWVVNKLTARTLATNNISSAETLDENVSGRAAFIGHDIVNDATTKLKY